MNIKGNKNFVLYIGFAMLVLMTSPAHAQWPTLDMTAIKESISSKVELVKQSKVVTEATQLAGKMNSAIGDAVSSVSKFAGDNLQKIKDQAKKLEDQKKRLEENKKKLEDAKKKADEAKEKMEKAKKAIDDAKEIVNDAKEFAQDAKSKIDEAKQMAEDVKSQVNDAKQMVSDVKSQIDDAKQMVSDAKEVASGAIATAQDAVSSAQGQISNVTSQVGLSSPSQSQSSNFVDDYVADYEAGINSDAKSYELPTSSASTGGSLSSMSSPNVSNTLSVQTALPSLSANTSSAQQDMSSSDDANAEEMLQLDDVQMMTPQVSGGKTNTPNIKLQTLQGSNLQASGLAVENSEEGKNSSTESSTSTGNSVGASLRKPFSVKSNVQTLQGGTLQKNSAASVQLSTGANTSAASAVSNVSAASMGSKTQNSNTKALKLNTLQSGTTLQKATSSVATSTPSSAASTSTPAASSSVKTLSTTPAATSSATKTNVNSQGFRQRAIIKNNGLQLDKGAWLNISAPVTIASYKKTSTLMFGAEDTGSGEDYVPDGIINNGQYDETIIPESLVWHCNIGVDKLEDPSVMENCVKGMIRDQSDDDNQVAEEGKKMTNKVIAESVVSTVAESMQMKNIAANYEDEVLNKFEEQAGSASTSRDDSSVLALTNKEIQVLLNKLITIAATQLSLDAMNQISSLTKESLGEDGSEDSSGNEDQGA